MEEIQALLGPVNANIEILTTQAEKAKEAYEEAVAKATEQEHAEKENPQGETPKGAHRYMAWLCTPDGNDMTAEGHETFPEMQKAWQVYAEGTDLEKLKPIAWATSIGTATVEKNEAPSPTPSLAPTTIAPDAQPATPTATPTTTPTAIPTTTPNDDQPATNGRRTTGREERRRRRCRRLHPTTSRRRKWVPCRRQKPARPTTRGSATSRIQSGRRPDGNQTTNHKENKPPFLGTGGKTHREVNGSGHHHSPTSPGVEEDNVNKTERRRRDLEQQLQHTSTKRFHDHTAIHEMPFGNCTMHDLKETCGPADVPPILTCESPPRN